MEFDEEKLRRSLKTASFKLKSILDEAKKTEPAIIAEKPFKHLGGLIDVYAELLTESDAADFNRLTTFRWRKFEAELEAEIDAFLDHESEWNLYLERVLEEHISPFTSGNAVEMPLLTVGSRIPLEIPFYDVRSGQKLTFGGILPPESNFVHFVLLRHFA